MKRTTNKQKLAVQLIGQGLSARQAMLRAGYKKSTASNPKNNLLSKPQVLSIAERMDMTFKARGVDEIFLANKLADMAQSDRSKEFIMAYDRIAKIKKIDTDNNNTDPIKRQITLTEYLDPLKTSATTTTIVEPTPTEEPNQPHILDRD